jgi:hypothetical protein
MRKITAILCIGMLLLTMAPLGALAAGNSDAGGKPMDSPAGEVQLQVQNETGPWQETAIESGNATEMRLRNETEHQQQAPPVPIPAMANGTLLRQQIRDREHQLDQERNQSQMQNAETIANQNRVRLAVHAFLLAKDELGGIGQNVSAIAQEFNNSVQATTRAEERIRTRNAIVRFFTGGDEGAAGEIEQEVIQNRNRIQQMEQLVNECGCDEEIRAILREQLQNMTEEQERLSNLAHGERADRGLFGWLWK